MFSTFFLVISSESEALGDLGPGFWITECPAMWINSNLLIETPRLCLDSWQVDSRALRSSESVKSWII